MDGFDLKSMRMDKVKVVDGTWMEYIGECKLLVARIRNPKMEAWLLKKQTNITRRLNDTEQTLDIFKRACAKFVLLGWTKLFLDDVEQEYSEDLTYKIFIDFPDFYETVLSMAGETEAFRAENTEADAGN